MLVELMLAGELSTHQLTERLFGKRKNGGPLYAAQTIYTTKHNLNRKLAEKGMAVVVRGRSKHARYALVHT